MVFEFEPQNDYELEELDEYQLFNLPSQDIVTNVNTLSNHQIHYEGNLPRHLILGVTESAHTLINAFGFNTIVGNLEMGSMKWDIRSSDDGSVWVLNVLTVPEPNRVAAAIVERIPVQLTSIIDIVSDDQVYYERRDEAISLLKLESSAIKEKSNLPKLSIPGLITGISAALLSMVRISCNNFLVG